MFPDREHLQRRVLAGTWQRRKGAAFQATSAIDNAIRDIKAETLKLLDARGCLT
jgi:L-alanine-DL-glutamate epimerase-like enolase superfamily enzyme